MAYKMVNGKLVKDNSKFQRGTGVYTCTVCGRRTRETDQDAASLKQCAQCYEIGGLENLVADSSDPEEIAKAEARIKVLTAEVEAKGGKL